MHSKKQGNLYTYRNLHMQVPQLCWKYKIEFIFILTIIPANWYLNTTYIKNNDDIIIKSNKSWESSGFPYHVSSFFEEWFSKNIIPFCKWLSNKINIQIYKQRLPLKNGCKNVSWRILLFEGPFVHWPICITTNIFVHFACVLLWKQIRKVLQTIRELFENQL